MGKRLIKYTRAQDELKKPADKRVKGVDALGKCAMAVVESKNT